MWSWKSWNWPALSQETAVGNAREASAVLARRRWEREDAAAFVAARSAEWRRTASG